MNFFFWVCLYGHLPNILCTALCFIICRRINHGRKECILFSTAYITIIPSDAKRLVLPPSVSIPLALGFYFLFKAILPANDIWGFFPGFILGYLFYDISHYAIHHFNFKGNIWKTIKQHHMLHHYQDPNKGYGVSSPFWDKIFRSDFIKK